jgi:hypothetical protein
MGKQRREQLQDSIFADNPFVDGFLEWLAANSATGDAYCLAHHVTVHAKKRRMMLAPLRYIS